MHVFLLILFFKVLLLNSNWNLVQKTTFLKIFHQSFILSCCQTIISSDDFVGCGAVLYHLMSWNRILFDKLLIALLVKKFPILYGTQKFVTVFTRACHFIFKYLYCLFFPQIKGQLLSWLPCGLGTGWMISGVLSTPWISHPVSLILNNFPVIIF